MKAVKTISYWIAWLFWYSVACVPAALFGSTIAAAFYGFHMIHKLHTASYLAECTLWEVTGGIVSAVPGFVWVCLYQLREHRKQQEKMQKIETAEADDASVWSRAPRQ